MQWTWTRANSGRWWATTKPGELKSMGSRRAGHDMVNVQDKENTLRIIPVCKISGEQRASERNKQGLVREEREETHEQRVTGSGGHRKRRWKRNGHLCQTPSQQISANTKYNYYGKWVILQNATSQPASCPVGMWHIIISSDLVRMTPTVRRWRNRENAASIVPHIPDSAPERRRLQSTLDLRALWISCEWVCAGHSSPTNRNNSTYDSQVGNPFRPFFSPNSSLV